MFSQVIIVGAGAAGLMCAISAAENGKQVLILDHANKAGKKILISGGGRCNFTNMTVGSRNYLSNNPNFCISALSRYTPWDFIAEVDNAGLAWHEEKLGQLFSDHKSDAILTMLLDRCHKLGVHIALNCQISSITKAEDGIFSIESTLGDYQCQALVIASGAMSFASMGATDFGHRVAKQFGITLTRTSPGLVPLTFDANEKSQFDGLAGVSLDCLVECNGQRFRENILFTHKGLSGPAILQISSYWQPGDTVSINCLPDIDLVDALKNHQASSPNKQLLTILQQFFPQRLIKCFCDDIDTEKPMQAHKHQELEKLANVFHQWQFIPSGTEGYKKAEVTLGGVDTNDISSKTFEVKKVKGLYFIGEVLDVTGHLGGFNFQWAWASGYCCGQAI